MKNALSIIAILAVAGVMGWHFVSSQDKHGHDHDHPHEDGHHDEHHEHELVAKEPVRADGEYIIATSFYPLQFALEQIVGDRARVTNVGTGRDPHDFRPSTQDILAMQQADLVVLQGAEFEPWGDDVQEQLKAESVPFVLATAELELHEAGEHGHDHGEAHKDEHGHEAVEEHHDEDEQHDEADHDHAHGDEDEHMHEDEDAHNDEHGHAHGAYDPHTWLDPVRFSETVEHLAEAVATLDPENAAVYEANAAGLQAELAALHNEYETALATCAVDEVIVSHDAFGYLAERYGISMHAIAGLSTQDTPSLETMAELKEEAEEGVNAILLEESSVSAYGETLAAETGLQTLPINPAAYVIPTGDDYLSLMRANLESLETALACNG